MAIISIIQKEVSEQKNIFFCGNILRNARGVIVLVTDDSELDDPLFSGVSLTEKYDVFYSNSWVKELFTQFHGEVHLKA